MKEYKNANSENNNLKQELEEQITDNGIEELLITKQELAEKKDKINELTKQIVEYENLLKRKVAEFDNYRRRVNSEREEFRKLSNEKIIIELLPVLDNFEKAIESAESKHDYKMLLDGIMLIYKQFKSALKKFGLEEIESLNKEFDPNLHEALQIKEENSYSVDTVIGEWLKGYKLGEKIIRHSKVIVARGNEEEVNVGSEAKNDGKNDEKNQ